MKTTLKQLDAKCRQINPYMRKTRYGLAVCRMRSDNDIAVKLVNRKDGSEKVEFIGAAREVDAYLSGLVTGVAMERVGEEEEDGSDA